MNLDYKGFVERYETTKDDTTFVPKIRWNKLNENNNIMDIVPGFPVNKRIPYDRAKMVQAIQNGMIILLLYSGDEDKWRGGRERIIYPMVLGINKNTKNELIRGWHLEGFSVSQKAETKKVWRLFKATNIKGMIFTGNFYRLPPKGYKMNDRVMTESTIARADFNTIRRNQEALIKAGKIEKEENVKLQAQQGATIKISIKKTDVILNLKDPWNNDILSKMKNNSKDVKISILKTIFANNYIAIVGALGEENKTVAVYDETKKLMGSYKTIKSFTGDLFKKFTNINNLVEFDLYSFEKKL